MPASGHSPPASKRSKLESPITHHTPLALPGSSWKSAVSTGGGGRGSSSAVTATGNTSGSTIGEPPPNNTTSGTATGSGTAAGGGASGSGGGGYGTIPNRVGDVHSPPEDRPAASGSGTAGGAANVQTDFDAINDAVGISGVDIAAEEELARQQSAMYGRGGSRSGAAAASQAWSAHHHTHQHHQQQQQQQPQQRVKIMDFLDKPALTVMVQHIAASYQLKTLEPAILDVLTQAAEQRIHSLLIDAIAAKEHRVGSSHLRPPPLYENDSAAKGKQRECGGGAMYDQLVYDEPERILSMLARVEGEEERAARLARAGAADGEPAEPPPPPPTEPPRGGGGGGEAARKERKRKREGPGQQAKNMSEDARARQSNQTAMRSVGGRTKYSWLSGGAVSQPRVAPASTTAIMAALPAPKFAPQRAGSNGRPGGAGIGGVTGTGTRAGPGGAAKKDGTGAVGIGSMGVGGATTGTGRLGGIVPGAHRASLEEGRVGLRDCVFALERERGSGAGRGSGSRSLFKTYVIGRAKD